MTSATSTMQTGIDDQVATATCPAGSRLTGAGAAVAHPNAYINRLEPRSTADGPNSVAMFATVATDEPQASVEAGVWAYCVTSGPATRIINQTATSSQSGRVSVAVPCPAGTHVVGGGAKTPFGGIPAQNYLASSFPASDLRSWNATAVNLSTAASVTGYAICADAGPATQRVASTSTAHVTESGYGADGGLEASVVCPDGTHVTGGGTDTQGSYLMSTLATANPGGTLKLNGWSARAKIRVSNIATIVTYAVCESDQW
ncbi:hypothetical protein ABZ942_42280 [Nocardia sp. NPDC046473]|uniref:hypothetical protein n=1 Tax=Nocardia sp. NPDC046473 TaxID=3155733 RepID=UPI0033E046F7